MIVSWQGCRCYSLEPFAGHRVARCGAEGCSSAWYSPPHCGASEEDDGTDLAVCQFDLRHAEDGVPAARILDYGPDDFMPACDECAGFFQMTTWGDPLFPPNMPTWSSGGP